MPDDPMQALERENERLRAENAQLTAETVTLSTAITEMRSRGAAAQYDVEGARSKAAYAASHRAD